MTARCLSHFIFFFDLITLNAWRNVYTLTLYVRQFSPCSSYFFCLTLSDSQQQPVLTNTYNERPVSHPCRCYSLIYSMSRKYRIVRNIGVLTQFSYNTFNIYTTKTQKRNFQASAED
jgi:hypothetical protein